MAEGGINEEFELQDRQFEEYREEYDSLSRDDLEEEYNRLTNTDSVNLADEDTTRRLVYIDSLLGEKETLFTNEEINQHLIEARHALRNYRLRRTRDNKDFLREHLGADFRVIDGANSKELIHNMKLSLNSDSGKISKEFRGVKVADVYADKTIPIIAKGELSMNSREH